jgi:nitrogenase molybdenum-iron protein alpha chain
MSPAAEKKVQTRERRSNAISAFHGTLENLLAQAEGGLKQAVRTMSQCAYDDILYAAGALSGIRGAAVVVHGCAGCAAFALSSRFEGRRVYSTALDERDSILGGGDKLREAILSAVRAGAGVIFVLGSPVIAINNDEVEASIPELEDETGAKIIFVNADGFRSKVAATGFDAVSHSLLRGLVENSPGGAENFVNLISMSEKASDIARVVNMLKEFGAEANVLPLRSSVEAVRRAGAARASVAMNPGEGGYLAAGLEEKFGVRFIRAAAPVGMINTRDFVRAVSEALGAGEAGERYAASREAGLESVTGEKPLAGASVFLNMDLNLAAGFADMTEELGGVVAGVAVPYIDDGNKRLLSRFSDKRMAVIAGLGQPFEIANALSKIRPDFYAAPEGTAALAASGAALPVVLDRLVYFGYEGISAFADYIKRLRRVGVKKIFYADRHKKAWLAKSGNWHVKLEVR